MKKTIYHVQIIARKQLFRSKINLKNAYIFKRQKLNRCYFFNCIIYYKNVRSIFKHEYDILTLKYEQISYIYIIF